MTARHVAAHTQDAERIRQLLDEQRVESLSDVHALAVARDQHRRRAITWHDGDGRRHPWFADLTSGQWPGMCDARSGLLSVVPPSYATGATRQFWCTRRAGHSGRHAAGNGLRIMAVWSGVPR